MTDLNAPSVQPPVRRKSSGWAWFFAGTTLALAIILAALLWALASTGLYPEVIDRLGPAARGLAQRPAALGGGALPSDPVAVAVASPTEMASPATPPASPATPPASPATPASRSAANPPARTARIGDLVESGDWKLLVNSSKSEPAAAGRRVTVDFTIKNDQERAATLTIPATVPPAPRARPASLDEGDHPSLQPIQLAEPPALRLSVLDRAERVFGGGFVSAAGQTSGSYTFEAAPRDAIRLTYAFELPAEAADPLALDASFGVEAGGQRARVGLDGRADPVATLAPSEPPKSAGKDERLQIGSLWAITAQGFEVGRPGSDGQRTVTVRLRVENLSDQTMTAGGTLDDPTGGSRDFYAVDAQGQLAYSSADTMPRTSVPARQTRNVEVRLKAGSEFATSGPYRLSIVVDARRDRYAVFKLP